MKSERTITIFEGSDCTGKTTLAKKFAFATGAKYVHCPALPLVNKALARMYLEATLPALMGYQDVVLDRCWLSEEPYGKVFRNGANRLTPIECRILERVVMRCGAVVVHCHPPWHLVQATFESREREEMLKNIEQLEEVYRLYGLMSSALPILQYDYSCSEMVDLGFKEFINSVNQARMPLHKLDSHTAGNLNGSLVAVGKPFKDHTDKDLWTRLPFMHTDNVFEVVLWHAGVCERDILWVPQDSNLLDIPNLSARNILARSSEAEENLLGSGLDFFTSVEKWVHHPRRFIC